MTIRPAKARDIPYIAAMHIDPPLVSRLDERIAEGGHWFSFYSDKVWLYFRLEPEGVLVAEEGGKIIGFCIASRNSGKLRRTVLIKGLHMGMIMKALLMCYGFTRAIIFKGLRLLRSVATARVRNLRRNNEKGAAPPQPKLDKAMIWALVVVQECRGAGVGRGLIEAACEYAGRARMPRIGVMAKQDNAQAVATYTRSGFHTIGARVESVGSVYYMVRDLGETSKSGAGLAPGVDESGAARVVVRPATIAELPEIAALHFDPPERSRVREIVARGGGWYNLYLDKVRLYHRIEPEGLLVARDSDGIAGYCITSQSAARLKYDAFSRGMTLSLIINALHLRYGASPAFWLKTALLAISMYGVRAVRTGGDKTRAPLIYTLSEAKIWAFVVATECRGKGVGQALLDAACLYLRKGGNKKIGVMVGRENQLAIRAYSRAGFRIVAPYFESVGKVYYMERPL
ncbi:MAG: GNAT family N-acetyltransferase [Planctomycetota bacterium]|nr:GNAT family N-acetyltransferase [Planctomycetota bacterium]